MGCGSCGRNVKVHVDVPLKAPKLNTDGSIEFPEDRKVPVIEGYSVDPTNEQRLIPESGCGCAWRITGIMLNKDGTYKPHHVCRHSKCEHRGKPVDFNICKSCPFREE